MTEKFQATIFGVGLPQKKKKTLRKLSSTFESDSTVVNVSCAVKVSIFHQRKMHKKSKSNTVVHFLRKRFYCINCQRITTNLSLLLLPCLAVNRYKTATGQHIGN